MSQVYANWPLMEAAVGQLAKVVTDLSTETDQMITDLSKILGEAWEGGAKGDFIDNQEMWNKSEAEMRRQLGEAAAAVQTAKENYMAAEARNRASWTR
ncbi:WXG100 family type VII secretion target [Nonomuraea sp. 3-1Str]|uniref:WXG100 family type VII secretion target n=1 Tax=unclassified Nonomuraea TaxID=2593643 RepID=UPI002860F4F2|nr:WXG100 family type VII secretion target [Nonomuraea sp. 3-1Str]MDR8408567.1 WXG100 family type VII secretion target [Nonomuraea sp. 3-1Str]